MENKCLIDAKIPAIDVIRCIATIQIVLFHMCASEAPFAEPLILWGREGVGLFFAISGAGLINKYWYQIDYKTYYKKRIVGIYIPFWVAYIAIFMRNYLLNGFRFPWELKGISKKYMLLSVIGVDCFAGTVGVPNFGLIGEWFLGVIIFIYFIFPLWRKIFIKFPTATTLLFLIFRIAICIKNPFSQVRVHFSPITALSNFSIGAYIMYLFAQKRVIFKNKTPVKIAAVFFSIIFIVLGKYLTINKRSYANIGEILATLGLMFLLIAISPYVYKYAGKFVKFICGLSYDIFLVHHVVINALTPIVHNNFTAFNAAVGYIIILSVILMFAYVLNKITVPTIKYLLKLRFGNKLKTLKQ